jgi:hypothetical protein
MATEPTTFIDWTERETQKEWFKVRHVLEDEIAAATRDLCRDYGITVRLSSATIATLDGVDYLRVPVTANWQGRLEQTIAYLLISRPVEDDARALAVAQEVEHALQRWIERDVPITMAPVLRYPEPVSEWPPEPESKKQSAPAQEKPAAASAGTEKPSPAASATKAAPAKDATAAAAQVRAEKPEATGSGEAPASAAEAVAGKTAEAQIADPGAPKPEASAPPGIAESAGEQQPQK